MKKKYYWIVGVVIVLIISVFSILLFLYGLTIQSINQTLNTKKIVPCESLTTSCPQTPGFTLSSSIINSSGFIYSGSSNNTSSYVLPPGKEGRITFKIYTHTLNSGFNQAGINTSNGINLTNYAGFCHEENITLEQNITYINFSFPSLGMFPGGIKLPNNYTRISLINGTYIIFPNGTNVELTENTNLDLPPGTIIRGYKDCITVPKTIPEEDVMNIALGCGMMLRKPPTGVINDTADLSSHPGVNVSFEPESETLGLDDSTSVTAIISADSNAPKGTYTLIFTPGIWCRGIGMLLTIGTSPYTG